MYQKTIIITSLTLHIINDINKNKTNRNMRIEYRVDSNQFVK